MPKYSLSSPFRCVNRADKPVFGILVMSNMTIKTSQCDHCVFKLIEDQSTPDSEKSVEDKYQAIRKLMGAPRKPRYVHIGGDDGRTETCSIDSPTWNKKNENIYCTDRVDIALGLDLETVFSLRHSAAANKLASDANRIASNANRLARDARIWAIMAAIIATAAIVITTTR